MDKQLKRKLMVELGKMLNECEMCEEKDCQACPLYKDMRTIGQFLWKERPERPVHQETKPKERKDRKDWAMIDTYIIEHYDKEPLKTIALNTGCCQRTICIRAKQLRERGLLTKEPFTKKKMFTEEELLFIRENVGKIPTKEIAEHLGRSQEMVRRKIREMRDTHGHEKGRSR